MENDELNTSGMQNPIFRIMNEQDEEEENIFQNFMMPPLIPPPFSIRRNNANKKYSNETIDKMIFTLKEFNKNITHMMETTNRMNLIIEKYNENNININFIYNRVKNFSIKCKLEEKLSDIINRIKTGEDNFNINNKIVFFNGRNLDLNKTVKQEGIKNGTLLMINDK